jgi:nucleotide-binding universal stress UspA family protein
MKVLVAIDDSPYSHELIDTICKRHWAPDTKFKIVSVIEPIDCEADELAEYGNMFEQIQKKRKESRVELCSQARHKIEYKHPEAEVHFEVRSGSPKNEIIETATVWGADKIMLGAHGKSGCPHFALGSVSNAIAAHAKCNVEVIRSKKLSHSTASDRHMTICHSSH